MSKPKKFGRTIHKVVKTHKAARHKSSPKKFGKRFCPNCGNVLHGTSELCSSCSIPDFKFKDIKIVLCTSCHSYLHKNKWTKYQDVNTAISVTALEGIKSFVKIKKISKELKEEIDSHKAGIKDDLNIEVVHKTQIFDIPAKLEVTLCPKCSKEGTQFFDSTIQLRNCTEEILAFARNEVKKQQKKGIFITKEVPLDKYSIKDIDMFLTNQTYAKTLAEKIKKNFGGTIKKNAKHFSLNWQTTKTLYRLNILLQLPSYKKNDVIKEDNHLYKIISIGDKIRVEDLRTKHKTSLPNKESYDLLHPVIFQVIKRYPEYEVLDPNTYYQARLMNPSKKLEINQKIKVIIDGSEAWMV